MEKIYGFTNSHDKQEVYPITEANEKFYNKQEINENFYHKNEIDKKISGHILSGTEEPSADLGVDGDIYLKYGE